MIAKQPLFISILILVYYTKHGLADGSSCPSPHMELLSDDPRRTCTDISASKNVIEHKCSRRIKDLPKAMIKYCPVEICRENGTWSEPSISCAVSECYRNGNSEKYVGHRICTNSGRMCQRWDVQWPHKHKYRLPDMFPDPTLSMAEAFCRDPTGLKGYPWCYTTDPDKKWEACDIPLCYRVPLSDKQSCEGGSGATTVSPPSACAPDRVKFQIQRGYKVDGKEADIFPTRSAIECASGCGRNTDCTMFGYNHDNQTCSFYSGDVASKLVKSEAKINAKIALKICVT